MPCYDPRERESDLHNSRAAQLLCELMRTVERYNSEGMHLGGPRIPMSPELLQWWHDHNVRDAKRV